MFRKDRIEKLLLDYVATITHTGTESETNNEKFWQKWIDEIDYCKKRPNQYGYYPVKNDHLNRKICWALY